MKGDSLKNILVATLVASLFASSVFLIMPPREANAGGTSCVTEALTAVGAGGLAAKVLSIPTSDLVTQTTTGGTFIKDCILTPIAIRMARTMAKNISNSIVNWINTGFKGSPSFVTNFGKLTSDSADEAIGNLIYGSKLNFLCQPFAARIRLNLATKYQKPFQEQIRCSISDITKNTSNAVKNNGGVGWNHWLEITTQPQNNEYGAQLMADSELTRTVAEALDIKKQELSWSGGFAGWRVCDDKVDPQDRETAAEVKARIANAEKVSFDTDSTPDPQQIDPTPKCKDGGRIVTPGKFVEEQGNTALQGWSQQLNLAKDIDQIVGALISHFADKMISGAGGFLGLSSSGGYAKSNVNYNQATALANDTSNPDNAGLADANAAANLGISTLFPTSQVSVGTNLATGAVVTESSAGIGSSAWVTDGDTNTSAATAEVSNPWIEIDLGKLATTSEIHIWSPVGKSAADSIGTFDVVVSKTSGARDSVSDQATLTDASPNPTVIAVNKTARFIRIERFNNSYSCNTDPETGSSQTCYHPLEIGEIEVIAPVDATQAAAQATQNNNQTTNTSIAVGPASGNTTITRNGTFSFIVPINSSVDTSVSFVEVRLYSGSNPVAFNSVFANGVIGVKQSGATVNNYPAGAPGVDFTNVSVGPTSNSSVTISGTALTPSGSNTYRLTVTARDASRTALNSETINFVVQ